MAERRIGQLSFADDLVAEASRPNVTLERIASLCSEFDLSHRER